MKNQTKLKKQIFTGLLILGVAISLAFSILLVIVYQIKNDSDIQVHRVQAQKLAIDFRSQIGVVYSNQADLIINNNSEVINEHRKSSETLNTLVNELRQYTITEEENALLSQIQKEANNYINIFDSVVEIYNKQNTLSEINLKLQYREIDDQSDQYKIKLFQLTEKLIASFQKEFEDATNAIGEKNQQAISITLIMFVLIILGGIYLAFLMFKIIRRAVDQIKDSAISVSLSTSEISQGNQDLSVRTQEQAAQLDGVFSTVERMTSTLDQSVQVADQSENISRQTLEIVKKGNHVVAEMMNAMREITESNRSISEIISKVNDIAFQTNLLALNAAVEAARAGDQGRGFAVVAAEVRNLAGRSAEFAKDIAQLVQKNISKVETGNELMIETKKSFSDIVTNTGNTVDRVVEITNNLRGQAKNANSLRSIVIELNDVTQQNASLVEEIASSSESMNKQAEKMIKQVDVFE